MSGNIVDRKLDPNGCPASLSAPIVDGQLRRPAGLDKARS